MSESTTRKTTNNNRLLFFWFFLKNGISCLFFLVCCGGMVLLPLSGLSASNQDGADRSKTFENYEQRRRAIATRMEMATIWVIVENKDGSEGMGSGFIVGDGYVLTNAHVASKKLTKHIYIMNEALPVTEAYVVASALKDKEIDFALLRFEVPAKVTLPVLTFNTQVHRMDKVSVWGYPLMVLQFDQSLNEDNEDLSPPPVVYTEGAVSAIIHNSRPTIIHSAAIAAGNSGGPLVNRKGEVVGINTWGSTEEDEGAFINASLPTSLILPFLRANGVSPLVVGLKPGDASAPLATQDNSEAVATQPEVHKKPPQKKYPSHISTMAQAIDSAALVTRPEAHWAAPQKENLPHITAVAQTVQKATLTFSGQGTKPTSIVTSVIRDTATHPVNR